MRRGRQCTLQAGHDESLEAIDFVDRRDALFDEARLHPAHDQMVKRLRFEFRVDRGHHARFARGGQSFSKRRRQLVLGGSDLDRKTFRESAPGESEGAGRRGAGRILGLRGQPADPGADRFCGRLIGHGLGHAMHQIVSELPDPVVEYRDQEFVLAAKMSVKRLVGEAGLGEDRGDLRVEGAGPFDDREGGLDQAGDFVLGCGSAGFEASGHRLAGDGARRLFNAGNVVLHIENGILGNG